MATDGKPHSGKVDVPPAQRTIFLDDALHHPNSRLLESDAAGAAPNVVIQEKE